MSRQQTANENLYLALSKPAEETQQHDTASYRMSLDEVSVFSEIPAILYWKHY